MKTKIAKLLVILFACFNAHSQTWQWANTYAGTGTAEGWAVCADPAGNAFLTGSSTGSFVMGTYTVNNTAGIAFLVKYNPNGNVLWVRSMTSQSSGKCVYTDNAGNVFMSGSFTNTLTVGPNSIVSAGGNDAFLIKYDPNGNVLWLRRVGGSGNLDVAYSVCTDALGNSVITGQFNSPSITLGSFNLINTSIIQYFLVKYDPSGNVLWAVTQQSGLGISNSVCTDANNNVFITGYHSAALTIGQYTLPQTGPADFFLAKYDPSGTVQWAATGGGPWVDKANYVSADPLGNIYITGIYDSPTLTVGSYTFSNAGNNDVFIVKYNNNGNLLWARKEGGSGWDEGFSLASYSGGFFLAGALGAGAGLVIGSNFINPIAAGPNSFGSFEPGMFLAQYDAAGNPLYSVGLNGVGDDQMAICLDKYCNLYLGGDLANTPLTLGTLTVANTAYECPLMAKMNIPSLAGAVTLSVSGNFTVCSGVSTTLTASGANSYTWAGNAPSNSIVVTPTVTSNYVVAGIPIIGCAANTATQTVFVNPSPLVSIAVTNTSICQGVSTTLTASGANTYLWNGNVPGNSIVVTPTITTNYAVTGISGNGCSSAVTQSVFVNAPPPVSIAVTNTLICKGQTVTLTAQGANSYSWNGGSQLSVFTVSPVNNISYTVTGTSSASGCSATAVVQLSVAACQSIHKQDAPGAQLRVYPNPNRGDFTIELNDSQVDCELLIVNSLGQTVHHQIIKPGENYIKGTGMSKGVYNILLPGINKQKSFGQLVIE